MKSSLDLLSNEHDVPVPVIEKIVYLKLSETVLELIHMPDSIIGKDFHFA
jgi:lactoylglutathione lyase